MIEIVWQYDPQTSQPEHAAARAADALQMLEAGNRTFASLTSSSGAVRHTIQLVADDLGIGHVVGQAPAQAPFAAVLSCADARVPPELVFSQAANDLFVVRVAGNVLGSECLGSFDYAVAHLASVRLLLALGHTGCGAVAATVDAYLHPAGYLGVAVQPALRTVVDGLMAAVHSADATLRLAYGPTAPARPGHRAALRELAVCLNAALVATLLHSAFAPRLGEGLGVAFGVYNLATREVGLPAESSNTWAPGLAPPPTDEAGFRDLAARLAYSPWIAALLDQAPQGEH